MPRSILVFWGFRAIPWKLIFFLIIIALYLACIILFFFSIRNNVTFYYWGRYISILPFFQILLFFILASFFNRFIRIKTKQNKEFLSNKFWSIYFKLFELWFFDNQILNLNFCNSIERRAIVFRAAEDYILNYDTRS